MRKIVLLPRETIRFAIEIVEKRHLIYELTKRDYKSRYMGSVLGFFWSVAQPIAFMSIMWFVFTFGLKGGKLAGDVPFVAYMFTAQIAWAYFSDSLNSSTNVILEYSFLVKKMNFRLGILPIVKLLSSLINHIVLLMFVCLVLVFNGYRPDIYWLQFFYYLFCIILFSLGLSWITCAMNVFWKDIGYIISIFLQFGFWLTPIFWQLSALPPEFQKFVYMNPMYYVINGYRNSFIYHRPFWNDDPLSIIQFWSVTVLALLFGMIVFKRLRPHFADVI